MHPSSTLAATLGVAGAFLLTPFVTGAVDLGAQETTSLADVASTEVAVSRDEASLRVELTDGDVLEIRLEDGRAWLDGEELGAHDEALGAAWRELLGRVVTLDDGPLARALVEWEAPSDDTGGMGARIDRALEDALRRDAVEAPALPARPDPSSVSSLLGRLLGQTDRLAELAVALQDLNVGELSLHVGEDVVIEEDETVDATVLVIDGDLELFGEVTENVVVVHGTLRLGDASVVGGDVRVAEGRLLRNDGQVAGVIRELDASGLEADIRREVRDAERRVRDEERRRADDTRVRIEMGDEDASFMAPLRVMGRNFVAGVTGVVETFVSLVVLSILGVLVVMFGRSNLEVVAETARRSPGRSAVVGLAGAFLTVPVWILGLVALCISIIGIPVALAWLPLFPLAVVAAAALGFFAVAQNAGTWVARRRYPYMDWVRSSNPYTLVVGGLTVFMAAFFLANVLRIFGLWIGVLQGMLIAAGVVITTAAALVGFGAVLLTRAGRRPEYYGGTDPFDDVWGWDPTPPSGGSGGSGSGGWSGGSAGTGGTGATAGTGRTASGAGPAGTAAPEGGAKTTAGTGASGASAGAGAEAAKAADATDGGTKGHGDA